MSTLLHVILDRAPALATLAQECKGCPGTLCKGCHGTEHEGGCPYAFFSLTMNKETPALRETAPPRPLHCVKRLLRCELSDVVRPSQLFAERLPVRGRRQQPLRLSVDSPLRASPSQDR